MSVSDDEFLKVMKRYIARNEDFINKMSEYVDIISHEIQQAREVRTEISAIYEAVFDVNVPEYTPDEAIKSHLTLIK